MADTIYCWDDEEREEGTITRVDPEHNGWFGVTSSSGWSCGVSAEYGVEPKVGDAFVTWGSIGRPIRGQAINGRVLYYRTPAEQRLEDQRASEKAKAERIAEYESKRSEFDARVLALPEPLRARIEAFRAFGGDSWRWSHQSYELMCCEEAAKIAGRFKTGEAIKQFGEMDWSQQRSVFPEQGDGHSGNSWGASLRLAYALAEKPQLLVEMHGALCPLVGCEDYGCAAFRNRGISGGATEPK